jgi:hypothetical protein
MAKVKIQGNASGTGVLTVTAPNTSTDRTITLPDATGTLLNSNGSGANLTSLPNGSQLDHSGTKKIEASSDGALITGEVNSNGGGFRVKSGSSTLGGIFKSGYIAGDGTSDVTVFSETGKKIHFCANGSATKVLSVSNDGLLFNGDTAAANALNDYEEGTWTPTAVGGASGLTKVDCHYTKIGNMVHLQGRVYDFTGINSSTLQIGGLPFNPQYSSSNGIASTTFVDLDQGYQLWMHLGHAEPKIYLRYQMNNAQYNSLVGSDISGSTNIHFNATYITAS